ncbi:unnamed protein product [Caenorhabditis angaria]|uniref:acid phosphatase n=1 Tax=Caenorhabditis angaria TaxID=860376 RepID=A0A9P1NA49_9PELO|nr:unnamed protein product [Caenorhabditis angaria]
MNAMFLSIFLIGLVFAESELLSVHAVFRHGARAPIEDFTSEEAKHHFYRGLGQLTDEGVEHGRIVGRILRDRYVNTSFLDKRMLTNEIYLRSSGSERCLMTMNAAIDVMFPNAIPPVQTIARDDDFLLIPKYNCPVMLKGYKEIFNLTEKEFNRAKKNIWEVSDRAIERAAENTTYLKDKDLSLISSLILEKDAGLAVPSWFDDKAYKEAEFLFFSAIAVMSGTGPYYNPEWIRPKSGLLLHTIFENIKNRINCISSGECDPPMKKFVAYATHDIMIMALLESLGIREAALGIDSSPEFCSLIIFELWMIDGAPQVKILYRRKPEETTLINLSGNVRNCQENAEYCAPEKFTTCCNQFITSNPREVCYGAPNPWKMNSLVWLLIGIIVVLSLLILIISLISIRFKKQCKVELKH